MSEQMRELFIEELEEVQGGAPTGTPDVVTTMMCCEELIFDHCCIYTGP